MPRNPREDAPGTWHHVMNRGLARRTVFEDRADMRYFLSRIAYAVRRNEIEIHAYSLLATHYHLMVRSLQGKLSYSMMLIQNQYVRWFNRKRRRDGPLFRGRFRSFKVSSRIYWHVLLRYINHNAISARLADSPEKYPYSSAFYYFKKSSPLWLERSIVEEETGHALSSSGEPVGFSLNSDNGLTESMKWLVETRISRSMHGKDPLDNLVHAAPASVRNWMIRKAKLADGSSVGQICIEPDAVLNLIARHRRVSPDWMVRLNIKELSGWTLLDAGLLRTISGMTLSEICQRMEYNVTTVQRYIRHHKTLIEQDTFYAQRAAQVTVKLFRRYTDMGIPRTDNQSAPDWL